MSVRHGGPGSVAESSGLVQELSLVDRLLAEQQELSTAVLHFSKWHERARGEDGTYRGLIPLNRPAADEQYAFEVDLDRCTACKACVVACHSLNGLDERESWRDVGAVHSGLAGRESSHTVTTACHHCIDPACANGCPVLAYEKDPTTGIVRHLDDQCIGCSYCMLKCPYDAPKYNRRLGIVRKCDMCHGRLTAGEAPACVQACPNGAIRITVTKRSEARSPVLLPGAFASAYTGPTTRYLGAGRLAEISGTAVESALRPEEAHTPLAVMLVLTQAACGVLWLSANDRRLTIAAAVLAAIGLAASVLHLGQPLKAWRAFLGWRRSWLSREIMAFGAFGALSVAAAMGFLPAWCAGMAGLLGLGASVMVYADTQRAFWRRPITAFRFIGSAVVAGLGIAALTQPGWTTLAVSALLVKMTSEAMWICIHRKTTAGRLHFGPLGDATLARFAAGLGASALLAPWPLAGATALLLGEVIERSLFFRGCPANRMPGVG